MECHYCGEKKESLPFRCNYCGDLFCGEHRLPENHACPRVGGTKQPGYAKVQRFGPSSSRQKQNFPVVGSNRPRFGIRYAGIFSKTERKHVLAAGALLTLVGLSLADSRDWTVFGLSILIPGFLLSFLGHELAHKFLARRNGLWAEYRTNLYGLMLTAVSVVLPFKFLAPGQTNIQGNASKDVLGTVFLIGPAFNIAISAILLAASRILFGMIADLFLVVASFNAWVSVINLIPFGSLDGTIVFGWDKTRWAIALAGSVILIVLSYYYSLLPSVR